MRPKKGYALATILILLGVCMFGAAALVTISILESKISRSQTEGTVAYYAAEAGVTDAVWRLNNVDAYKTATASGTLNVTYTATDIPAAGQGFTVTMTTAAQGAGYALVDVVGTSNNGAFTATRHVQATVFQGGGSPSIGSNVFFAGGGVTITNGASAMNVSGGDFYSRGAITINSATLSMPGQYIQAEGNYVKNGGSVTVAGVYAANFPPAPTDIVTPGYDFTQYSALPTNKCTAALYASQTQLRCTPAQLQSLVSGNNFTFPNQVVYVDGSLTMNNWVKNKTLNITGLFVVNGDMSVTGAASNFHFNVNTPASGKSGIIVKSNLSNAAGTWVVNGVIYASGSMTFTNSQSVTINGALVSGGTVQINTGLTLNLTYNAGIDTSVLGGTTPTAVQVLHWEEEY